MVGPPQLFGPISPIGYVHRDRGTLLGHYLDPTRSSNYLGHCMPTAPFMIANTIMVWGSLRHPASIPGSVTQRLAPHHDGPRLSGVSDGNRESPVLRTEMRLTITSTGSQSPVRTL